MYLMLPWAIDCLQSACTYNVAWGYIHLYTYPPFTGGELKLPLVGCWLCFMVTCCWCIATVLLLLMLLLMMVHVVLCYRSYSTGSCFALLLLMLWCFMGNLCFCSCSTSSNSLQSCASSCYASASCDTYASAHVLLVQIRCCAPANVVLVHVLLLLLRILNDFMLSMLLLHGLC